MRRKLICLILLILILGLVGCNIHIGGHDYGPWQVVEEATCTEDGLQERICSCGEKETQVLPALDHDIVVDEARAATCTKDGATEGSHCARCKLVIQEQEVIVAGHTEVAIPGIAPTCARAGKEDGAYCSVCGEIVLRQKKIRHQGHDYVNGVCTKCSKVQPDMAAAIVIDQINEKGLPSFYTKRPYPAGSTVTFQVYVPEGASWWAVSWTRNAADAGIYNWSKGDGVRMNVEAGQWQYCTVTLPEDSGKYYIYIVGAKGEWGGKALLIDDVTITAPDGEVLGTDRFTTDVADGLFNAVKTNPTSGKAVVISQEVCAGHWSKTDEAVAETCDTEGKTEGAHCGNCGKILKLQEVVPATGHKWDGESCSVCGKDKENLVASIVIDQLNEGAPMNFITKQAYAGGSTVTFRAYVPNKVTWWAMGWTTDVKDTGLYKWNKDSGKYGQMMTSVAGKWAEYSVTLPEGGPYYLYFVGEKGKWNGKELQIDEFTVTGSDGTVLAYEDFDNGVKNSIFDVITVNPTSNLPVVSDKVMEEPCKDGHTVVIDPAVEPTCTQPGLTKGKHCSVCDTVIVAQEEIPAKGHTYGSDGKCACGAERANRAVAIKVDLLSEDGSMNFITRTAYEGGTTLILRAFVPEGVSWWAVNWTTDPADVGLYKASAGLGQYISSQKGQWADYYVTLPNDGNSYYFYIVGAKGEWNEEELLIDDVIVADQLGKTVAESNFDNGMHSGIFKITETDANKRVIVREISTTDCMHANKKQETGVKPTCTAVGSLGALTCTDCDVVLHGQIPLPMISHQWENGECAVCHKQQPTNENHVAAIYIDNLTEETASFITKDAYAGGSEVSFKAYVPYKVNWWAVCWTTDPANVGLYKAAAGLGQYMSSQNGQWADYTVTLPDDGNDYYIYIVGAKGEWNGKALLIDDVTIGKATEDFEKGLDDCLFDTIKQHGANTIVELQGVETDRDPCADGHTVVTDEAVAPGCTAPGLTEGSHCSVCELVLVAQEEIPATGHTYGSDGKCACGAERANRSVLINMNLISDEQEMSFITRTAYEGGSTLIFRAFVPEGASWWGVCWTTDPSNAGLYKAAAGLGQYMSSQKGQWADYYVTLPNDGNSYYFYIVGAKGEWNEKELIIDDVILVDKLGQTVVEDSFDNGMHSGIFKITEKDPNNRVVIREAVEVDCLHIHKKQDSGVTPDCTNAGSLGASTCKVCGVVLHGEIPLPAIGHQWVGGECSVCREQQTSENHVAAVYIDNITEETASFITKDAYAGGSKVEFNAYVPAGTGWWAVCWTTDPADVSLYKAAAGLGQYMTSQKDQWAEYSVTLPDDGNSYYIYIVGAKGEWGGKALMIDNVTIGSATEDFEKGLDESIFNIVKIHGANTIAEWKIAEVYIPAGPCENGHTEVIDPAVAPGCTETGLTEGSHCSVCGEVIVEQTVVEAAGHQWENGECSVCHKPEDTLDNHVVALYIDNLTEENASLITKDAYAGGTKVDFQAYVPAGSGWWAVCWTTDPADVSLYKAAAGLGQYMTSQKDQWADYSVTLPDDGNSYYIYIVGAKGEWGGNALMIDNVTIGSATEDFEKGFDDCLFNVVKIHGANTIAEWKIAEVYIPAGPCENGHTEVVDPAVAPGCTETGLTEGSHCSVCGEVIVEQTVVEAAGHQWANGECSVCHKPEDTPDNHVVALYIDNLTEENASFITKDAYAGGTKVSFQAYVPAGTGWWAVCWTTDPANVGLYKWTSGLGQSMSAQKDQWADYSVTLPNDSNSYYIYIVGAKGEWGGKALLIDNVTIGSVAEDFENGLDESIFNIVKSHGANTIAEWKIAETENQEDPCASGHTEVVDPAVAPGCTETGLTEGSHCSVCGEVIVEQTVVEAAGHQWADGECSVCHEPQPADENSFAAIYIDNLTETTPMSFITKEAYAGGSTVSFKAFVPTGASWWAVSWTTDPANAGLYKWTAGLGKNMKSSSVYDAWAEYSVTLPDDGNSYYIYIVGAKGEWGGKALLIDNVTIGSAAEDFEKGFDDCLFNVVKIHGANTVVELQTVREENPEESAGSYATAIYIDNLTETTPMSFITKEAYAGGSTVSFKAFVPTSASWWAVSWTTDPANAGLYKWTAGLGKNMKSSSVYDAWAEYSVTLPDDGNSYYVYIVGAKGEWGGKALLIDDVTIGSATEDFENGFEESLFNVVQTHGANTIVELKRKDDSEDQ